MGFEHGSRTTDTSVQVRCGEQCHKKYTRAQVRAWILWDHLVAVTLSDPLGTLHDLEVQRYSGYAYSDSWPAASTAATEM